MNSNVKLLDEALSSLCQPILVDNPILAIDSVLSDDKFTRVVSTDKNSLSLVIDFSESGVDVHIDGSSEVFSWGRAYIEGHSSKIVELFCILLASNVEVQSYGENYKKIIFIDVSSGVYLKQVKVFDGLFINPFKKNTKTFLAKCRAQK